MEGDTRVVTECSYIISYIIAWTHCNQALIGHFPLLHCPIAALWQCCTFWPSENVGYSRADRRWLKWTRSFFNPTKYPISGGHKHYPATILSVSWFITLWARLSGPLGSAPPATTGLRLHSGVTGFNWIMIQLHISSPLWLATHLVYGVPHVRRGQRVDLIYSRIIGWDKHWPQRPPNRLSPPSML